MNRGKINLLGCQVDAKVVRFAANEKYRQKPCHCSKYAGSSIASITFLSKVYKKLTLLITADINAVG
jgi:hypothetical protein